MKTTWDLLGYLKATVSASPELEAWRHQTRSCYSISTTT